MDYTYDVEMALEEHPEKINELNKNMKENTDGEAYRVLTKEIDNFYHSLIQIVEDTNELSPFQKTLADSVLGYMQDNEFHEDEMKRLASSLLNKNKQNGTAN